MKNLVMVLALFGSMNAMAADMDAKAAKVSPHNVSGVLSFGQGSFNIGAGYEYMKDDSMGVGGHFRVFSKDNDRRQDGVFLVGATASHHFYKKNWDLSFAPSLNIISIDGANSNKDKTGFGPGLSIGLLCQVTDMVGVGFDYSQYFAWFDSDISGKVVDDLAVKVKVGF